MRALSLSESSLYPSACVWFCARAKEIRARAGRFAREQGNPRASREIRARAKEIRARAKEIRARAGRFALAHYINLLSRYKNVLSTFGSKITPYISAASGERGERCTIRPVRQVTRARKTPETRSNLLFHAQNPEYAGSECSELRLLWRLERSIVCSI